MTLNSQIKISPITYPSSVPAKPQMPHLVTDSSLRWYAVYTWARHEKAVARHFDDRGLTYFLPLYQATHRWNKRSSRVSLPLFPGYVFVRTGIQDRFKPLQVPGVLHYVGTGAVPCPIANDEIDALKKILVSGRDVGPHPYLTAGQPVRISAGPLAGLCGIIQRTKSGNRFVVSVETIKQSIAIELDGFQLASIQNPTRIGPKSVGSLPVQEQQCV